MLLGDNGGMMFCHVVAVVFFAWGPVGSKLASIFFVVEPMVFQVRCFQFLMTLLLTMPSALVLSICIGAQG
jgi:hypothetical protein